VTLAGVHWIIRTLGRGSDAAAAECRRHARERGVGPLTRYPNRGERNFGGQPRGNAVGGRPWDRLRRSSAPLSPVFRLRSSVFRSSGAVLSRPLRLQTYAAAARAGSGCPDSLRSGPSPTARPPSTWGAMMRSGCTRRTRPRLLESFTATTVLARLSSSFTASTTNALSESTALKARIALGKLVAPMRCSTVGTMSNKPATATAADSSACGNQAFRRSQRSRMARSVRSRWRNPPASGSSMGVPRPSLPSIFHASARARTSTDQFRGLRTLCNQIRASQGHYHKRKHESTASNPRASSIGGN
jgi:hypothetical protein